MNEIKSAPHEIKTLSAQVIDTIAAGEVVERPAHLIKELIENSIDAGASEISVDFSLGGRQVVVSDNGHGIAPRDLVLALSRFATSKISTADDLWKLKSFGFRGEALASIASVSRLLMSSRTAKSDSGFMIESQFGQQQEVQKMNQVEGTKIQIRDLFENVPARLKFLKSESAESTQIKNVIKALALAHPQIEFKVLQNKELISFWSKAKNRLDRAKQVLQIEELFEGVAERDGAKAHAIFSSPLTTAKTSRQIWSFAQNRWVQDRTIQAAVIEAYRSLLMHGEFPYAIVWVELDPAEIDVNVHPTKSQVKFVNTSAVFRAVHASVRDTLEKGPWIPKENKPLDETSFQVQFQDPNLENRQYQQKEIFAPRIFDAEVENKNQSVLAVAPVRFDTPKGSGYWSKFQIIGQGHLTYIICQDEKGIMFVDQHAAHERVIFEKLSQAWRGAGIEVQDYLFPLTFDLSPEKTESLMTIQAELKKMGIEIELMGPSSIGVRAAPALIKEAILAEALDKASSQILELGGSFQIERTINDICATTACHSAIRAGQALSVDEMKNLLVQMDEYPLSSFCPHGRNVFVPYNIHQLEKDFGRIT